MGMTKEEYEIFSKARLSQKHFDDDLFGESLDLSSKTKDDEYYWSIYGQCWLPK